MDQIRRHKRSILVPLSSSEDANGITDPDVYPNSGVLTTCNDRQSSQLDDEEEEDEEENEDEEEEEEENEDDQDEDEDDEEEEEDEDDDGYQDHRGSSSFSFQIFDDLADPLDDQVMAESARTFLENQRRIWFRTQFLQYAAAPRQWVNDDGESDGVDGGGDDDDDE